MARRGFPPTTFEQGLAQPEAPLHEPPPELESTLAELERGLAGIDAVPDAWMIERRTDSAPTPREQHEVADEGRLLRGSLRAILAATTLSRLDARQRSDARVQARIAALAPEVDATVLDTLERLRELPADRRAALDERAREADFVERAASELDAMAANIGITAGARARLDRMVEHLQWQLERTPLSQLLDTWIAQLDAAIAKWGIVPRPAYAGLPAALLSERLEPRAGALVGTTNELQGVGDSACDPPSERVDQDVVEVALVPLDNPHGVRWARRGRRSVVAGVGLSLLGVGVAQLEFLPGAFTVTAGVVMLVAGIVLWIYGELRR